MDGIIPLVFGAGATYCYNRGRMYRSAARSTERPLSPGELNELTDTRSDLLAVRGELKSTEDLVLADIKTSRYDVALLPAPDLGRQTLVRRTSEANWVLQAVTSDSKQTAAQPPSTKDVQIEPAQEGMLIAAMRNGVLQLDPRVLQVLDVDTAVSSHHWTIRFLRRCFGLADSVIESAKYGIKSGTAVTIVGQFDYAGGHWRVAPHPVFGLHLIRFSTHHFTSTLKQWGNAWWLGSAFFGSLAFVTSVYCIAKWLGWRPNTAARSNRRLATAVQGRPHLLELPENEPENSSRACVVCLDHVANVAFGPCGHMCTCPACADTIVQRRSPCPLCREPIETAQNVFVQ